MLKRRGEGNISMRGCEGEGESVPFHPGGGADRGQSDTNGQEEGRSGEAPVGAGEHMLLRVNALRPCLLTVDK